MRMRTRYRYQPVGGVLSYDIAAPARVVVSLLEFLHSMSDDVVQSFASPEGEVRARIK